MCQGGVLNEFALGVFRGRTDPEVLPDVAFAEPTRPFEFNLPQPTHRVSPALPHGGCWETMGRRIRAEAR